MLMAIQSGKLLLLFICRHHGLAQAQAQALALALVMAKGLESRLVPGPIALVLLSWQELGLGL